MRLPPQAAVLLEAALGRLLQGERVAVLAEDQELSPNDAAAILGISRPLVVHRMDLGDLPFRYVGKHRRAKLRDVLALKATLDAQRRAMAALAEDAEDLRRRHACEPQRKGGILAAFRRSPLIGANLSLTRPRREARRVKD